MNKGLDVWKNSIAKDLFIDIADQDYILARFSYYNHFFNSFFWNASQAIEKYSKASLLLNGYSVKHQQHNLQDLLGEVSRFAGDLLPQKLAQPELIKDNNWLEETPSEFLSRLERYLSVHNRYNVFGYVVQREDIHHLDQLVFALRRVAVNLNSYPFLGLPRESRDEPKTFKKMLEKFSTHQPHGKLKTERGFDGLVYPGLKDSLSRRNYSFGEGDAEYDEHLIVGFSFRKSVLYTRVIGRLDNVQSIDVNEDILAAQLASWAVENIKLPKEMKVSLEDAERKLRERAGVG